MARTYRASIISHVNNTGAEIVSTLHYQTDLTFIGDEPDPDDVAAGVWSTIGSSYRAATVTRITIDRVDVLEMVIKPDLAAGGTHIVGLAGTLASPGGDMSQATCLGINLRTTTRSRSSRGFMHMPPPLDHQYSSGQGWTGGYLTLSQTVADTVDDSFDLGTINVTHVHPVVYSRLRHQEGLTPYTFRVTQGTITNKQRYVRSRDTSP
jgi:hypothetical protein